MDNIRSWIKTQFVDDSPVRVVEPEKNRRPKRKLHRDLSHMAFLREELCYDQYDPDSSLFYNRKSVGFILSVNPLFGATDETINHLESVLCHAIPEGADLQVLCYASPAIGEKLAAYRRYRENSDPMFQWLAKMRADYLLKGVSSPLLSTSPVVLRDFQFFCIVSMKRNAQATDTLLRARDRLSHQLHALGLPNRFLPVRHFLSLMRHLLSPGLASDDPLPDWLPFDSLSNQVVDIGCQYQVEKDRLVFKYADRPHWVGRTYSVKRFPSRMALWQMNDSIGHLFRAMDQMVCPFLISLHLRLVPHEKANAMVAFNSLNKERNMKGDATKLMPSVGQQAMDFSYLKGELSRGRRVLKASYQVCIFPTQDKLAYAESQLQQIYRGLGWELHAERGLQWPTFLSVLPFAMSDGLFHDFHFFRRLRTLTTYNAANIVPLQGDFLGTPTPGSLYVTRRGQVAFHDSYDHADGNANVAVTAASGRGKTVWAQDQIVSLLSQQGCVWVIDAGRSYQKLCQLLGGTFIEFPESHPISINPFANIQQLNASMDILKNLIATMAHPSGHIADEELIFIEQAISACWHEKGQRTTITDIAAWLECHDNPLCQNLVHLLYPYTEGGSYADYFTQDNAIDLSNPFVVLELDDLKNKKALRQIILMTLMADITQKMYLGDRRTKKLCIIDEAWDLFSGEHNAASAAFIEAGYRTARRYFGAFMAITQDISDFFKSPMARAAYACSDFKVIFGCQAESFDQAKAAGHLSVDGFEERLLKSLRSVKGDYSEFALKTPSGIGVYRLILDPFSLILYSSRAEEFKAVQERVQQGMSLIDAIRQVAEQFYPEKYALIQEDIDNDS